ncbi:unnamed protein product [Amoebophrya sp. A120]|nr:unnamed protein product [Amoebophrya sp. A120]|eukprot:GSA120T00019453001.1
MITRHILFAKFSLLLTTLTGWDLRFCEGSATTPFLPKNTRQDYNNSIDANAASSTSSTWIDARNKTTPDTITAADFLQFQRRRSCARGTATLVCAFNFCFALSWFSGSGSTSVRNYSHGLVPHGGSSMQTQMLAVHKKARPQLRTFDDTAALQESIYTFNDTALDQHVAEPGESISRFNAEGLQTGWRSESLLPTFSPPFGMNMKSASVGVPGSRAGPPSTYTGASAEDHIGVPLPSAPRDESPGGFPSSSRSLLDHQQTTTTQDLELGRFDFEQRFGKEELKRSVVNKSALKRNVVGDTYSKEEEQGYGKAALHAATPWAVVPFPVVQPLGGPISASGVDFLRRGASWDTEVSQQDKISSDPRRTAEKGTKQVRVPLSSSVSSPAPDGKDQVGRGVDAEKKTTPSGDDPRAGQALYKTKHGAMYGNVKEFEGTVVHEFLGIPYAKPPVGELRFKSPQDVESWSPRILDATQQRFYCPQKPVEYIPKRQQSEDCLTLSVWVPQQIPEQDKAGGGARESTTKRTTTGNRIASRNEPKRKNITKNKLPILVWIHGGSFHADWPNPNPLYDGTKLAAVGNVIVATVNYRLGAVGAMSFSESQDKISDLLPGNQAMLDQQKALEFLKENFASTSSSLHSLGDPDRITVFGQSSGGVQTAFHLVSFLNKKVNLFGAFPMANFALHHQSEPLKNALELGKKLGCGKVGGHSEIMSGGGHLGDGHDQNASTSLEGSSKAGKIRVADEPEITGAASEAGSEIQQSLLTCLQQVPIEQIVNLQDWVGDWTTWTPVVDGFMFHKPAEDVRELAGSSTSSTTENPHDRSSFLSQSSALPKSLKDSSAFDISPMKNVALLAGCNSGEAGPDKSIVNQDQFDAVVQNMVKKTGWLKTTNRDMLGKKPSEEGPRGAKQGPLTEQQLVAVRDFYLNRISADTKIVSKYNYGLDSGFSKYALAAQAVSNDLDPIRELRELASLHFDVQSGRRGRGGRSGEKIEEERPGEQSLGSARPWSSQQDQNHSGAAPTPADEEHEFAFLARKRAVSTSTDDRIASRISSSTTPDGKAEPEFLFGSTSAGSTGAASASEVQQQDKDNDKPRAKTFVYEFTHGSSFEPTSFLPIKPDPSSTNSSAAVEKWRQQWDQWQSINEQQRMREEEKQWYHYLAPHGAELDFLWGRAIDLGTEEEKLLSKLFMKYVANFAYTGDPNSGPHEPLPIPFWPEFVNSGTVISPRGGDSSSGPSVGGGGGSMVIDNFTRWEWDSSYAPEENENMEKQTATTSKIVANGVSIKTIADAFGPRGPEFQFWRTLLELPEGDMFRPDFLNPQP